jgi:hypothetical protein
MKAKMLGIVALILMGGSFSIQAASAVWCVSDKFSGTRPSLDYTGQAFAAKIGTANYHCQEFDLKSTSTADIQITLEPGHAELKLNKNKFAGLGKFQFPLTMSDFKDARTRIGRAYKQAYREAIPAITEDGSFGKFQIDLSK